MNQVSSLRSVHVTIFSEPPLVYLYLALKFLNNDSSNLFVFEFLVFILAYWIYLAGTVGMDIAKKISLATL
jgi:hypothetical protein